MAHGRVQTPAANQPPVLTGMPVSGMAYLDRPQEAGYFLFPDLSVRHEGRYRLTFNLYEETKEDKDKDPDTPDPKITNPGLSVATGGSFDFRMEVKSVDFVVYSAKKFPGLSESTQLSRVVAEQGCRVRIRRDVRMRRRDRKAGGDYDNAEDEYARRRRTETPESRDFRARSMSGSAERTPYSVDTPRRPSGVEYPPHFPSQSSSSGGHLQFLGTTPQYAQPQSYPQPPSIPASPSYPSSQPAPYSHQSNYAPPQQSPYSQPERTPTESYAASNPSPHRPSVPYKRASEDFTRHQPPPPPQPQPHTRSHHSDYPSYNILPPAENASKITLPPIDALESSAPPASSGSAPSRMMPPLISPTGTVLPQILPHASSNGPPAIPSLMAPSIAGSKRTRDESFHFENESRYINGAREDPGEAKTVEGPLIYNRADGSEVVCHHIG